jgi:hypothetical protein
MLAAMASQTLLQRLGGAFWQAFTAHSPSNEANPNVGAPAWDADKIRRVLEGKAVLSVVDIEPEVEMGAGAVVPTAPTLCKSPMTHEGSKGCSLTAALEEGMRALSLSKE